MTHLAKTAASPSELTTLEVPGADGMEGRSLRARTEPMAVTPFGTNLYQVETESGSYTVDIRAGRCTCPDYTYRGARCKHLRRVAIEITDGRVPPPGHTAVECRDCDRTLFVESDEAEGDHYCPAHRITSGDTLRDRETGRRLVAVTPPVARADEVPIPGTHGTVAEYPGNENYDADGPVVGAIYPVARVTDRGIQPRKLTVYTFPRERLRRVHPAPERPEYVEA